AAQLAVFDVAGRRLTRLEGHTGEALRWDGRDANGRKASSGVYFYRIRAEGATYWGRLVYLRCRPDVRAGFIHVRPCCTPSRSVCPAPFTGFPRTPTRARLRALGSILRRPTAIASFSWVAPADRCSRPGRRC